MRTDLLVRWFVPIFIVAGQARFHEVCWSTPLFTFTNPGGAWPATIATDPTKDHVISTSAPVIEAAAGPGRSLNLLMAFATGIAVANIYYNQPMLALMERDLPGRVTAMIPTATQLGYALGLFLLVPLGDLVERRRLIVVQFVLLAVSLVLVALAPGAAMVLIASLLVGVFATVAQQIVPFAAMLAPAEKRGAAVGTVMSGLLAGILLSRLLAGFVGTHAGWRAMFWLGVPLSLAVGAMLAARLPVSRPGTSSTYPKLMRSLAGLWREFPALRLAAVTQALLFGSFSAFWSILALHLEEPQLALGAVAAGLFGVLGLTGMLAAPIAGRLADRQGASGAILAGALAVVASWLIFGLWNSVAGLVAGVLLLDFAVQGVLISNQVIVYGLRPDARSRLNTIFMGSMFLGGSAGSGAAALAWAFGGWTYVCGLGVALAVIAATFQLVARRTA